MKRNHWRSKIRHAVPVLRNFLIDRFRIGPSLLDQLGFSPFLVQLVVTRRCNLSCGYCNEYDHESRPVPTEAIRRRLDKVHDLGALAVEFTGGEPLLHPEIVEIVRYATTLGFPARMMISNACLFTEKKIKELDEAGLTELQISIDGVEPNDVTVKVLKRLREKLELVSRHARFSVQLNGVIGACPPKDVLEMIDFAREMGFRPRVLVLHDGDGQVKLSREELAVYAEVKRRMGRRFSESHGYREKLLAGEAAPFKCRSGARYLYVDEFGLVHPCSQRMKEFSKPLLEYTTADLKEMFYRYKPCNRLCTVGCARTTSAYDEWRFQREGEPARTASSIARLKERRKA